MQAPEVDRSKATRSALVAVVVAVGLGVAAVALLGGDGAGGDDDNARPDPEQAAPQLGPGQALLFGRVTDSATQAPLGGAELKIDQEGGALVVRTDSQGAFRTAVNVSRPIGLTIDAPGHKGAVAFGKLCPGERRDLPVALVPASDPSAPAAPMVLEERCR